MKKIIFILLGLAIPQLLMSQGGNLLIGISAMAIDDNAQSIIALKKDQFSYITIPTKLSVIRTYPSNLFLRYDVGYLELSKEIYKERYKSPGDMFFLDAGLGYRLKIKKEKYRFDKKKNFLNSSSIYGAGITGLGYTYKSLYPVEFSQVYTLNVGGNLFFNFLSGRISLNIQALGKFGLHKDFPKHGSNYIDFSAGIFCRLIDYNTNTIEKKTLIRKDKE